MIVNCVWVSIVLFALLLINTFKLHIAPRYLLNTLIRAHAHELLFSFRVDFLSLFHLFSLALQSDNQGFSNANENLELFFDLLTVAVDKHELHNLNEGNQLLNLWVPTAVHLEDVFDFLLDLEFINVVVPWYIDRQLFATTCWLLLARLRLLRFDRS